MSAAYEPKATSMLGPSAVYYARQFGWHVFPLHSASGGRCSCQRPDCGNGGKHPRTPHGVLDATREEAVIEGWWAKWPAANIGIATGRASGLVVLDVDPRNGGEDSLEALRLVHGPVPATVQSRTGGGGDHYLFAYPPLAVGEKVPSGKLAPGLDIKADGGYIVAPPSVHASGRPYAWEMSATPGEVELLAAPAWLLGGRTRAASSSGPSGVLETCFLYRVFAAAGWVRGVIDAVRASVRCPWEGDHTNEAGARDTSTVLFAPSGAHTLGWFHCSHAHCAGRTSAEVIAAAPLEAVMEAKRTEAASRATSAPESGPRPTPGPSPASGTVPDWKVQLSRTKTGEVKTTYGNVCLVLRHTYGAARLRYNAMSASPQLDGRALGDADVGRVREELEATWGMTASKENAASALCQVAEEQRCHPVRDYLAGLAWDGVPRIARVLSEILKAEDTELGRRMVSIFFVSAVARAMAPGCQVDTALVLLGGQGWRKSTFYRVLGGEWFSDTAMDLGHKDSLMQLAAAWIYEWAEIEAVTNRKEAEDVKRFITSASDTFRPPFARAIIKHPRSTVIAGSTNKKQFLTDDTGSRRFHVIHVRDVIDTGTLEKWRDQLWAEARTLYESGVAWYLTHVEDVDREQANNAHAIDDALADVIGTWLRTERGRRLIAEDGHVLTASVLTEALKLTEPGKGWGRDVQTRVGVAFSRLGWRKVRLPAIPGTAYRSWAYAPPTDGGCENS